MQRTRSIAIVSVAAGAVALAVAGLLMTQRSTVEAQGIYSLPAAGKFDPRQLDDLRKIVGNNQVSVFTLYNANPMRGRIISINEFFGRRFLQIQGANGSNMLVNIDTIVAINQEL